jgi:hypothetical protein
MNTVSSRPYLPDLGRSRLLVVLVGVLVVALVLLALGEAIAAGTTNNSPSDLLLAPFRWNPAKQIA